ncbi:hypothetical protein THAOC_25302 [Thalassiosira oceanica]|uniref:Uncharacterized protein n=1 Tax=Thalassiosira oceanica TaxID=159749 RepID=K0RRL4_THAOC|nr:hypothetical protein THAOC_25302 [Thalassiosira oceanica]|eukprot:EJK55014.1 hypothetical protein THAOC_25302 [Thalassiosira oceanica]
MTEPAADPTGQVACARTVAMVWEELVEVSIKVLEEIVAKEAGDVVREFCELKGKIKKLRGLLEDIEAVKASPTTNQAATISSFGPSKLCAHYLVSLMC